MEDESGRGMLSFPSLDEPEKPEGEPTHDVHGRGMLSFPRSGPDMDAKRLDREAQEAKTRSLHAEHQAEMANIAKFGPLNRNEEVVLVPYRADSVISDYGKIDVDNIDTSGLDTSFRDIISSAQDRNVDSVEWLLEEKLNYMDLSEARRDKALTRLKEYCDKVRQNIDKPEWKDWGMRTLLAFIDELRAHKTGGEI